MSEPEQYILEDWDDICATAHTSLLSSECPLLEDEVLVEMHKYVTHLNQRNNELEILLEDVRIDLLARSKRDSEGVRVVNLSASIWNRIKKALIQK